MMKWLTYDLETTFLRKGFKRKDTLIIEIALHGKNKKESFQRLVNPLKKYSTGLEIIQSLDETGQSPDKSIHFWVKLLSQKKMMNTSVKRKSVADKAELLAKLLNTSNEFITTEKALTEAIDWGKDHKWIAHNGTSFDSKIVKGQAKRFDISTPIDFSDSLPFFRHYLKDEPSYSQPILYKSMFKGRYMAHHALEDAKALHKMLLKCGDNIIDMFDQLPKKPKRYQMLKKYKDKYKDIDSDLIDIKGVGPKSVQVFRTKDIHSKEDLKKFIITYPISDWLEQFKGVHAYKKLGDKLYSGELIL